MPVVAAAGSFVQRYTPVGHNLGLSALLAVAPVVVLLGLLGVWKTKAHTAALAGLATALLVAVVVYEMPGGMAGSAALNQSIAGVSVDRRIQLLLIAFCFGAFMEGSAGFGTPIAICAAMLIGIGFKPIPAAGLSLIGNTAPVAFGAIGTPIITLASVTGIPLKDLSAMVGRQLPFFSLLLPFWLVAAMVGFRRTREVWPACLTTGLSFAVVQFLVSNFHGPWLVDIAASIASIAALVGLLRFWQPKETWRFAGDQPLEPARPAKSGVSREVMRAWLPWVLLAVLVFLWGIPQFKTHVNAWSLDHHFGRTFHWPGLDGRVKRVPPVVPKAKAETAVFDFFPLSATGTALLLTGILSGLALGLGLRGVVRTFFGTLYRVRWSLLTIAAMLGVGFTTRYAGLDASMGLALAKTGVLFAFFSPLLGWLGVALTGSDTSSNALFGGLQKITAGQVGLSPTLAAASNSSGGVMGKMIDAQSIVVGGVATDQQGEEGAILRYVFFHSIGLASLVGVLAFLQGHVFTGMIP
jgi:lactate permease